MTSAVKRAMHSGHIIVPAKFSLIVKNMVDFHLGTGWCSFCRMSLCMEFIVSVHKNPVFYAPTLLLPWLRENNNFEIIVTVIFIVFIMYHHLYVHQFILVLDILNLQCRCITAFIEHLLFRGYDMYNSFFVLPLCSEYWKELLHQYWRICLITWPFYLLGKFYLRDCNW